MTADISGSTVADRIIAELVAAGIDTFFGVPGGPVIALFDAVLRNPRTRLIESRHETAAVFAAMGYWAQSGSPAGILVTAGPGGTNAITGMAAAHFERVPMVVLCGDVAWAPTGGRLVQEMGPEGIDIEAVTRSITRASIRLPSPGTSAGYARHAVAVATTPGRQGPVLLVVPIDHAIATSRPPTLVTPSGPKDALPRADQDTVARVAHRLADAHRPLIVLGAACRPASAAVRAMVEALQVPFVTTPQAKGVIDERHPLSLRGGGLSASWWARRYTADGVDVCLVLGSELNDISTGPTRYVGSDGELIHVDLDHRVFGRGLPTATGIVADLHKFAVDLAAVSTDRQIVSWHGPEAYANATIESPFDCPGFADDESILVAPHRVIHDLEHAVGPSGRFVTDIGEHMLFALHYLTATGPNKFGIHLGLGSMTSGIGSAVGRALADPTSTVVCICGDGGMQMAGSEFLVALEHRLPVLVAVFNDARYNMVYHGYRQLFGRTAPWSTPPIDFTLWAKSIGIPAAPISKPGEITEKLVSELMSSHGPALLDIHHDPETRIKGAGRVEALQQMSKAI